MVVCARLVEAVHTHTHSLPVRMRVKHQVSKANDLFMARFLVAGWLAGWRVVESLVQTN